MVFFQMAGNHTYRVIRSSKHIKIWCWLKDEVKSYEVVVLFFALSTTNLSSLYFRNVNELLPRPSSPGYSDDNPQGLYERRLPGRMQGRLC